MNLRNVTLFALGPIGAAALGLITVPVLAWAFSMEDIGRLNVLNVTVSLALLICMLGLDQAYVRHYHETKDKPALLKACLWPGLILLSILAICCGVFAKDISLLMYGEEAGRYFWITLYCVITAFISRFLSLILRMQERGLAYSMSQIIPKLVMLVAVGIIIFSGIAREFLTLQLAFLASTSTVLIVYAWNTRNEWQSAFRSRPDSESGKQLLNFGVPLVFSGVIYWGLMATSTVTLRMYAPLSELGLYSVTASFAAAASIFQSVFSVIWAPTVYRWHAESADMGKVHAISKQVLMAICVICALCGIFSWITDYLLPQGYASVKYLLLCALIAPLMYTLSEVTCVGIGITKRTGLTIWITLAAFVVNVLLSIKLVPLFGAAGAVVSNAIAYVVFFIMRTEVSSFIWRSFPRAKIYFFVVLLLFLTVVTLLSPEYGTYTYVVIWLCFIPLVGVFFRKEAYELLHTIKLTRS
ncbi:lipopolysaccharide biosynthesis protein [Rheinheimera nanhaiensis]|nr:lipopolysaccharide biosynthesis protein [Rheinheimera nanhaiensis]